MNSASSDTHKLLITLPVGKTVMLNPEEATNVIECFWIPVLTENSKLGYPIRAQGCTLDAVSDPRSYTIDKPIETLPAGKYLVSIEFTSSAINPLTFEISEAGTAESNDIIFDLVTSVGNILFFKS